ncbi:hypothetical protein [Microbispora sp. NBC_01389]|uniref:hypothetical protein n=1 Tax=Microbispora sp. NBC_01389 TaxID=2903584 RepID=UPI003244E6BF
MSADLPTSSGVPVTDELIAALAQEAEAGYDVDALRRKRPIGSAPADVASARLDPELRSALIVRRESSSTRGQRAAHRLQGSATTSMTTDELLELLRDE